MKIVVATHNRDKCREILSECSGYAVTLATLIEFPDIGEIEETGITLEENAILKAKTVHSLTQLPAIADDTGLEVDALNGAPGVYTARFAGENCTYMDNMNKMLNVMKNVKNKDRGAIFKTVIAFVDSNKELFSEGEVKGIISPEIKGLGGFGYDPIFYVVEEGKTFAEMTLEMKNNISHRGRAVKGLKSILITHLNKSKESA